MSVLVKPSSSSTGLHLRKTTKPTHSTPSTATTVEPNVPLESVSKDSSVPEPIQSIPVAQSIHYPDLSRDDVHYVSELNEPIHDVPATRLQTDESFMNAAGFFPSAPSFDHQPDEHMSLLQDVAQNASERDQYYQRLPQHQYQPPPQYQLHSPSYQPPLYSSPPVQHLQHPPSSSSQSYPRPVIHPVTVSAVSSVTDAAAAQARLAYLRSKAARAEQREQITASRVESNQPRIVHIKHRVEPGDDLTELAVRYGTTEPSIRALNRRLVFPVLDNVVGQEIIIPATTGFTTDTTLTEDAAEREKEARANREFHAIRQFQSLTKCSQEESTFYLEENNFNLEDAMDAYNADVGWEKSQQANEQKGKSKSNKSQANIALLPYSNSSSSSTTSRRL